MTLRTLLTWYEGDGMKLLSLLIWCKGGGLGANIQTAFFIKYGRVRAALSLVPLPAAPCRHSGVSPASLCQGVAAVRWGSGVVPGSPECQRAQRDTEAAWRERRSGHSSSWCCDSNVTPGQCRGRFAESLLHQSWKKTNVEF